MKADLSIWFRPASLCSAGREKTMDMDKYRKKLEKELHPEDMQPDISNSYSDAYKNFKKDQISAAHGFYEKACAFSEKVLHVTTKPKDEETLKTQMELAHINVTPAGVYSFAVLAGLLVILGSVVVGLLLTNLMLSIIGIFGSVIVIFYLIGFPTQLYKEWRTKAADQLVLAILYLSIYIENTSNLEHAVYFASKHLPPPISLDFMKVLWDVEIKKYSSIQESLEVYSSTWRDEDREFVEAIQLIESSLHEPTNADRLKTIGKAVEIILQGTEEHMIHFAHNLQSPVQTIHMLGIVLPVLGLVMLPMLSAFMGASINWWVLALFYNILLPVIVFFLAQRVLSLRPAGSNNTDQYVALKDLKDKPGFKLGNMKINFPPLLAALVAFILIAALPILYFVDIASLSREALNEVIFSLTSLFASMGLLAAVGISMATYYFIKVSFIITDKREVSAIEREFSSAIFQLANRIGENVPTETAFIRVAEDMPNSKITNLFKLIDFNIRQQGMSLRDAILDSKHGAILHYPSAIIRSVMNLVIEGSKKGSAIVASSLRTISQYLNSIHKVDERLKDLLADTVSSMDMQVKMFIPVISGIVVALAIFTMTILRNLSGQVSGLDGTAGSIGSAGFSSGIIGSIFQVKYMIPPPIFQAIVGIYLIEVTFILTFLLNGIINGSDEIELKYSLSKNLIMTTVLYIIVTIVCSMMFTSLVGPILGGI